MTWHSFSFPKLEEELHTSFHAGLSSAEAAARLKTYGPNELPPGKQPTWWEIFLNQFRSPLIYLLLISGVVLFFVHERTDAVIVLVVILFNSVVGSVQEGRAQNTLGALRKYVQTKATVLRDGKEMIVSDTELVPGDVVLLREGDKVPADMRLLETYSLRLDEAAMTGESTPVHKEEGVLPDKDQPLSSLSNMAFKGTHVVAGSGKGVVVATGAASAIGTISLTVSIHEVEIPLQRSLRVLSRFIIIAAAAISAVLFVAGIWSGKSAAEMLATVISLSVSIIPEGLPVVLTLVLATGVWRMARRHSLVKRLQAVEALGQARVIAVDKTGTITKNEMLVQHVFVDGKLFDVGGVGYEPKGDVALNGDIINPSNHPEVLLMGKLAALSSSAHAAFSEDSQSWETSGDPTEVAMVVFSEKIGFRREDLEHELPPLGEVPFNYKAKYHVVAHREADHQLIAVAGAPEVVLDMCDKVYADGKEQSLGKSTKEKIEEINARLSAKALRLVACAYAYTPLPKGKATFEEIKAAHLTFAGMVAMQDSLRPEIPAAVAQAQRAGIRVVMITGDQKATAVAIAKAAGIFKDGDVALTDDDIEHLPRREFDAHVARATVFARITPEDKMKIVESYRRRGEVVAMTGDGVNDAPSLVAADLGVAMGKIGTEVAKEAADIVLLDDNFTTIVAAVEEGRNINKTIRKVILYLFSTSLGEVLTIGAGVLLNYPLIILPAQILWLNLVTDGFLDVALAMEPKEKGLLERPPLRSRLVNGLMIERMFVMAIPMMLATLFLFGEFDNNLNMERAWTVSLTLLAVFQWFNAWNCRSDTRSIFLSNPFSNIYLVGATFCVVALQMLAIYAPFMQRILHTVPLGWTEWSVILTLATLIIIAEELRKLVRLVVRPAKWA